MAYQTESEGGNSEESLYGTQYSADDLVAYEQLLDLIADALILSSYVDTSVVENNQKFIRNGQLQVGQGSGVLALFQKDIKANHEDLNNTTLNNNEVEQNLIEIASNLNFASLDNEEPIVIGIVGEDSDSNEEQPVEISISINGGDGAYNGLNITNLVVADGNPLNVSQFVPINQQISIVDVGRAEEFLDTNIFELLPTGDTRQSRIIRFFGELNALLSPEPEFDLDGPDGTPDGRVDRAADGSWSGSLQYNRDNSISYAQDNQDGNIDEGDAFIHRLKGGSIPANDTNQNRTIEDIYNTILPYLTDILEDSIELEDMPEYKNESDGYLKFRSLNQGIIIRNTNSEFVKGLDPNNPTWLTSDYNGLLSTYSIDPAPYDTTTNFILDKAGTGFTITMWVRFLDKVSNGTLFNYGNPSKAENPFGFKLETYVVNKEDPAYFNSSLGNFGELIDLNPDGDNYLRDKLNLFQNTDSERFVRLQVREFGQDNTTQTYDRGLRSSEVGNPTLSKFTWNAPKLDKLNPTSADLRLLNNANIPENFNEWYFICASYNPSIIEPNIFDSDTNDDFNPNADDYNVVNGYDLSPASNRDAGNEPLFWMNHINPDTGQYVTNSGYGNKAKVEIISRTDLLRARGFKV